MTSSPTALVTGASRGIGAATAVELARRGFHVLVNYRADTAAATKVVAQIESDGGTAVACQADVCDPEAVSALVRGAVDDHGGIDVLVCNAQTVAPPFVPLASLAWGDFQATVTGELAASFFVTQQVLPIMRHRRAGRIVYVSSTIADTAGPGRLAPATAKSALGAFSRNVAAEAAWDGVTVLTVAPGAVDTDASAAQLTDERRAHVADHSILGRVLTPADIAAVIGLAADPAARPATGSTLRVDGGYSLLT